MIKWPNKVVLLGYFIKHRGLYFWRVHNHTVWFQTRLGKNLLQSVVYIYTIIRAYFEGHQNRHLYQKNVQVCTTLIFGKQIKLPNQFGNIHADSTFIIDLRSNFGSTMTKLCKIYVEIICGGLCHATSLLLGGGEWCTLGWNQIFCLSWIFGNFSLSTKLNIFH